jgi:hypothetical protein
MKKADLPTGAQVGKLFIQPVQLGGIHVSTVQRKKLHIVALKRVMSFSLHINPY